MRSTTHFLITLAGGLVIGWVFGCIVNHEAIFPHIHATELNKPAISNQHQFGILMPSDRDTASILSITAMTNTQVSRVCLMAHTFLRS